MTTWTLFARRLSAREPLFLAQWFEPNGFATDTAAVGKRLRVLGHSHWGSQAAGTLGAGSRRETEFGNCRCSKLDRLVGRVFV